VKDDESRQEGSCSHLTNGKDGASGKETTDAAVLKLRDNTEGEGRSDAADAREENGVKREDVPAQAGVRY